MIYLPLDLVDFDGKHRKVYQSQGILLLMAEILHQLRLVVYPIIYKVLAPSQVVSRISEPSTVWAIVFSESWAT